MRIDFLVGDNPYNSTYIFSKGLRKALERCGVKTRLFNVGQGGFYTACEAIMHQRPDLTCSFSDITCGPGLPLGDQWEIPHLSLLVDPAIYSLHQLKGNYSLLSCVDREDAAYIQALGFDRVFFLPHGVDSTLSGYKKKPYEVVMLGTLYDYEQRRSRWPSKTRTLLDEAARRVVLEKQTSILRALTEMGIEEELGYYHYELDLYLGSKSRVELVNALKGFEVHVWGNGPWKRYCPKAICHPSVSFLEATRVMKRAQVLLNCTPRFKHGSHERIFHGLMCGCLVMTGESSYIENHFSDGDSLLSYSYGKEDEAREKLAALSNGEEIAAQGRAIVEREHTWDARAQMMINALNSFHLV